MVTRKPVGGHKAVPLSPSMPPQAPPPPPVPATPIVTAPTPNTPSAAPQILQAAPAQPPPAPPPPPPPLAHEEHQSAAKPHETPVDSESEDDEDEWDKSESEDEWDMTDNDEPKLTPEVDIPAPLRISRPPSQQSDKSKETAIPAALRAGPPGGVPQVSQESLAGMESNNPWRSASHSPPAEHRQNPFLRPQNTGEALFGSQNSSAVWASGAPSPQPAGAVAELPATMSPPHNLDQATISELPSVSSPVGLQAPLLPAGIDANRGTSQQGPISASDPFGPIPLEGLSSSSQPWQEELSRQEGKQKAKAVDQPPTQSTNADLLADFDDEPAPSLPPRTSTGEEAPPTKPPRPEAAENDRTAADSPNTAMKQQRNQTYQIKKVRWFDDRVRSIRVSPILVQNANGPCPLLALVNALTLSTPRDLDTGLVEALRSREQVSLGLLLDAVFEELMSGRRGDGAQELPDVSELYSFLIALHTGMNVNPQYTRDPKMPSPQQPGTFEQTKEMRLYGTFNIPLMHGWIPEPNSEAYAAFDRSAKTYEDAQNIQFYEEELEAKLSTSGLNTEEQHMFEDLVSIKQFLTTWPTQLTEFGLDVIRTHLKPGDFAILFRNDHFSTLYKEPRSNSLLTVVTDAGYSSHEEIVWESLVDINGMRTELFSGDFRPVSHNAPADSASSGPAVGPRNSSLTSQPVQNSLDADQGWTQVAGKKGKRGKNASTNSQETGVIGSSSNTGDGTQDGANERSRVEQEDADLALALQLQEEEEERQRIDESDRRTRQLSSQVLDQSTPPTPVRSLVPPRRGAQFTTNRPTSNSDEAPPPSYEDASKDRRFNPPRDHPASPHAPISPSGVGSSGSASGSHSRQQSAYMENTANLGGRMPGGSRSTVDLSGRRRPSGPMRPTLIDRIPDQPRPYRRNSAMNPVGGPSSRDEKCVVM